LRGLETFEIIAFLLETTWREIWTLCNPRWIRKWTSYRYV